ncbi:hypothetical protein Vse01_29280 [Micromonospora sediminimaris]|uniref:Uncharacterized protein n=1 Tax=Micromonospora sediminimaris TaxID=547162 RepID=A0A9W5UV25_9ACTN|nr:hypothetical protein Vse01_29280 [Micromonospora sediminimaris]
MNNTPNSSRTRIARPPFGNAARATRTVPAGISPNARDRIDTRNPPHYANVGLQDHNQVLKADVTQNPN